MNAIHSELQRARIAPMRFNAEDHRDRDTGRRVVRGRLGFLAFAR